MIGGMWNPETYLAFADYRGRPFYDLLTRVAASAPSRVVDLGCGPGNLTETLGQRWPGATLEAWDSSPEMVAAAQGRGLEAHVGAIEDWEPQPDTDVVITNAALQWVPTHRELLVRWAGQLAPGAWIAFQVPGNFDARPITRYASWPAVNRSSSRCATCRGVTPARWIRPRNTPGC